VRYVNAYILKPFVLHCTIDAEMVNCFTKISLKKYELN